VVEEDVLDLRGFELQELPPAPGSLTLHPHAIVL
jgi:hypothetical protein